LHSTKTKLFTFSSDYKNWQQVRIVEKSIDVDLLTATSEYKFVFLHRFRIRIFQRSILFKTNNYHRGVPPWSEGPGLITPAAPPWSGPECGCIYKSAWVTPGHGRAQPCKISNE